MKSMSMLDHYLILKIRTIKDDMLVGLQYNVWKGQLVNIE